jgi:hypothetical protein
MRYAWLRERSENDVQVHQGCVHPLSLIRTAYNAAFWVFLLPFFTAVEYRIGFIAMTVVIGVRLGINLYTNNLLNLTPGEYQGFPFRLP